MSNNYDFHYPVEYQKNVLKQLDKKREEST